MSCKASLLYLLGVFVYATADEADAYMFYRCFFVFFLFLFFFCFSVRQKIWDNRSRERLNGFFWNFYQMIAGKMEFASPYPNWARPPNNFLGAKNWKIAIGAYSSELVTQERKRISERLKRLWNHKTMAYKVYVRPWPLTPEVNTVCAFARTSAKIPGFWRFSQNFLL